MTSGLAALLIAASLAGCSPGHKASARPRPDVYQMAGSRGWIIGDSLGTAVGAQSPQVQQALAGPDETTLRVSRIERPDPQGAATAPQTPPASPPDTVAAAEDPRPGQR